MAKLTGKEIVEMMVGEESASCVSDKMEDMVNSYSFKPADFSTSVQEASPEARAVFVGIALLWIKRLGYDMEKGLFDLRNEYSTRIGSQIYNLLKTEIDALTEGQMLEFRHAEFDNEELYDKTPIPYESLFVWKMGCITHRTLQQTFSSAVFKYLQDMNKVEGDERLVRISDIINEKMDEYFFNTPFI